MTNENKTTLKDRSKVRVLANSVFVRESDARKWLRRPAEELDGGRPLDLMRTKTGAARVEKALSDLQRWATFNH